MSKKIKILFIIPSLKDGGAERVITHILTSLNPEKYEMGLLLYIKRGPFLAQVPAQVQVFDLKKENKYDFFRLILGTRAVLKKFSPDKVVSFLYYTNIVTCLACLFFKRKFKLILGERNYPPEDLKRTRMGKWKAWLIKLTYNQADLVTANSELTKKALAEQFNVDPTKLKVIYNPLDINAVIEQSRESVEHPLLMSKSEKIIIAVGRLSLQKRFDRLLRVFSAIRKKYPKTSLIIIGDGKLKESLKETAAELNLNGQVVFAGFQSNPYAWVAKADVFVLSSDFEGFPNVVLEAMACGTPVVSTDCPSGPNEIITNGKDGFLVPLDNEAAMAEAIENLLKDPQLAKQFSETGRKRVEAYDIKKIIPQYEEIF